MASDHLPTIIRHAVNQLLKNVTRLQAQEAGSIETREEELGRALNAVGQAVMKAMLEAEDPDGRDVEIDGKQYWQAVRAEREYVSQFGPVRVERGVYRSVRNGPTVCPMELRAGIVEQFWTPRAAKVAVVALTEMTPYRASALFAELGGMQPSRSSLDRLPKALSRRWEPERESYERAVREADRIPAEAVSVGVSIDAVMLPMRDGGRHDKKAQTRASGRPAKGPAGYRAVGCGAVSYYDGDGSRIKTTRFGRMPEPKMATVKESIRSELTYIRAQRPDLTVVAVADGDPVLWEFLDDLQPDHSVVDFYHAAEHLKRALDLTDEPSALPTQERFKMLRRRLKNRRGGVHTVIRSLAQKEPRQTRAAPQYRGGITYFKRHVHRMNYPRLRHHHLPIGSGVVEGTCRWLVSDRMKRTGMRWDTEGGQAILTLRALTHSDRFETAWRLLAGSYTRPC